MPDPRGGERLASTEPGEARSGGADALFELDALLGTQVAALALPVVLPRWCQESLARDAARTGRTVLSIARWALLWPVAMVVVLALPTLVLVAVGSSEPFLPLWLISLVALGGLVAIRARGLDGFLLGTVGLLVGGALLGVGAWLVVVLGGAVGASPAPVGPVEALLYVPLLAVLVPMLAVTPFGLGLMAASMLAGLRR